MAVDCTSGMDVGCIHSTLAEEVGLTETTSGLFIHYPIDLHLRGCDHRLMLTNHSMVMNSSEYVTVILCPQESL